MPEVLAKPPDVIVETLYGESEPVSQSVGKLVDVDLSKFLKEAGSLLILGEPGSGKTIMLLEMTRLLVVRAESDPEQSGASGVELVILG